MTYFSEKEAGKAPRTETELTPSIWRGLVALIDARVSDGSFGATYPEVCQDGRGPIGTNQATFWDAMRANIPTLAAMEWWTLAHEQPPASTVMDMLEFCWRVIGKPQNESYHPFFQHYHLSFDVNAGRAEFANDVNCILRRNGLAYELTGAGEIRSLAPPALGEALSRSVFATGDAHLDGMLEAARRKFLDPDEAVRREALEKLWDAWERVKTVEPGHDKQSRVRVLLDKAAGSSNSLFRQMLETEARALTAIGNDFMIRHTETTKEPLTSSDQVDHLFHRMFALIRFVLRTTGRGG